MSDPFEVLHEPITPVDPDPVFAARLRDQVRRALLEPTGAPMNIDTAGTQTYPETYDETYPEPRAGAAGPAGHVAPGDVPLRSLTPYIAVHQAREALEWYVRVLGARRRGVPVVMDDERIGHAELAFGDSVLMFADEFPEIGVVSPRTLGGTSLTLRLEVPDVDAVVDRAVEHGAELSRPVQDSPHGRNGAVLDPFGHRWIISAMTPAAGVEDAAGVEGATATAAGTPASPRHGDVGYTSLWVPDVARAAEFYGAVLGWQAAPGSGPRERQVENLSRPLGLSGGRPHRTAFVCLAVDDVVSAVRRIRAAGGTAEAPTREPYGLIARCADDQGMAFAVYEPEPGDEFVAAERLPEGEIAYLTFEVPDSVRFRAFFGAVIGWEFGPGSVPDGWGARLGDREVRPMSGLHGGHERSTVVPMYAVDDIYAAVERVRAAGGTTTEPERMPYGISAECVDDQGVRFYLGQL